MRKVVEIRFADCAAADCNSFTDGIGDPVGTTAGIDSRGAIQMYADSAGIPGECVIVVVEAVPAGIKSGAVATRHGRGCAELLFVSVLQDRKADFAGEGFSLIDIPVPCSIQIVGRRNATKIEAGF